MSKDNSKGLKAFQLDYLKFQKKIFLALKILQCNWHPDAKYQLLRKYTCIGIMMLFLITNILSLFYIIEGDRMVILRHVTTILILFTGVSQAWFKVFVLSTSPKKVKELINWIQMVHEDPSWENLGPFVEDYFRKSLRYSEIVQKYLLYYK